LTDLVAQQAVAAIRNGATREAAAKVVGRSRSTLQDWLARGDQGEEPYASFAHRVREAEGKVFSEVHSIVLEMARTCEHPPTRLNACLNILKRETPVVAPGQTAAAENRDPEVDLEVARSVVAALESRSKKSEAA
jgi:transposase